MQCQSWSHARQRHNADYSPELLDLQESFTIPSQLDVVGIWHDHRWIIQFLASARCFSLELNQFRFFLTYGLLLIRPMKHFSYQKYYLLCTFNYVCLAFNYACLSFNYACLSFSYACLSFNYNACLSFQLCLFVIQLCPFRVIQLLLFVMQLWLSVIQLWLLVMQLCLSVRHSIMARCHSIIQYRLASLVPTSQAGSQAGGLVAKADPTGNNADQTRRRQVRLLLSKRVFGTGYLR